MAQSPTAPRAAYPGIGCLALSVILFEISLTRIFAVMMWHHFTYMVVSIALLGFGAAGSLLTARSPEGGRRDPSRAITRSAVAYGFAVMAALCAVTTVRIDTLHLWADPKNLVALLLIYALITVPFLLAGLAVGLALTRWVGQVNRLYFADLVGSAAGGGLSVWLLGRFGGPATVFLAGALGVLAALVFSLGASRRLALRTLPFAVLAGLIGLAFAGGWPAIGLPRLSWDVPFARSKEVENVPGLIEARLPSATAEVEVSRHLPDAPPLMGGNFGAVDAMTIGLRAVAQDGTAPTALFQGAGRIEDFPFLDDTQAGSAYVALQARGGSDPDVLVIGVGGGVDVMVALANHAARVDAVEINRAMIEMVRERFDDYIAGLFRPGAYPYSDRVTLVNGEGRSFVRHGRRRYDVIQMSGVDSFTALSTGAYTLSESYLYTVQAVREFYEHLKDGGYINYSRFILMPPRKPRETLRLAGIARTALEELGIADPSARIAVFQGRDWASTLIRKGPFSRREIEALKAFAERERFRGLVFDPLREASSAVPPPGQLRGQARERFSTWLKEAGALDPTTLSLVMEAYTHRQQEGPAGGEEALEQALRRLGPGSAGREAELRQVLDDVVAADRGEYRRFRSMCRDFEGLLRGDAAGRRAFIDAYPYDVTPCTDDSPFFFNYYRYSGLLSNPSRQGKTSEYHPNYPVGHMVLLSSLVQIVLLAFVLLILPLRRLTKRGVATRGKLRYLAYFSALGVGFMFVEIVLMQKMVIFLGHPTYSLSVVLTSLLGFAGFGSFLAGRLDLSARGSLVKLGLAVAVLIALTAWAVNAVPPLLLGRPFAERVAVALVMLLPVGVALGMPFPTGLRLVKERCPELLPWSWAINGFASVFSSVLCIVLSMAFGFTAVLLSAAGIYLAGIVALRRA